MTQWYVKELSQLTQVSVQTLHHYDRIGLLKPSVRLANGYRLYSEKDLLKLQQIIALKFFGFELSQIKTLLTADVDILNHFSVQSHFLEEKAKALLEASKTLKSIISDCGRDHSIPWETVIKLIEVYRTTQKLEKSWHGKVLSPEELKEYINFEQDLKTRFTENKKTAMKQEWSDLWSQINANPDRNPASDFGIAIGQRCMAWVNQWYGKKYAPLRTAIWEKGFKGGRMDSEIASSSDSVAWLEKAINAYYRDRIISILKQSEADPAMALEGWGELLTDMYGDDQALREGLIKEIMKNEKISHAAKNWLKQISKPK